MYRSVTQRLFKQYALLLSIVFILFTLVVVWSLKYSYYKAMEHTLVDIGNKIERKLTLSHFTNIEKTFLNKYDVPFFINIFEYIDGQYQLIFKSTDINILSKQKSFLEGFHIEELNLMHKHENYAEYDKTFEVLHRYKYHIVVLTSLYSFSDTQKTFFFLIFLFGTIIYILALILGYKYIVRLMSPVNNMIHITSAISKDSTNKRLVLPKIKDEFYTLSQSINTMLERLDNTLMKTKHFNAKVSHELRTPLTIIRGEIEVALYKERTVKEYQDLLYSTLEEIDTIQAIIDNMLLLTKLDFKNLHIKKLHTRLDKVVEEAILSCRMQYEAKDIEVKSSLMDVSYFMEETLLKQSIKNLVNNAIKYSPVQSKIDIILKKEGDEIVLEIHDEGYGISEKDLKHIFKPYYRSGNKELKEISGDGLGLAIVHHTLLIHDAKMEVESTLGKGTVFTIRF